MTDLLSINTVAARLGLSVHQLRRWELMFGLEIKRGRGQQRQYRPEDMTVLERIKELVEQGWPTSQIRPQLEAEGLITPKLIGMPQPPGNPEMLMEALIGFRSFAERRFIELSKQIDELRQLMISITLKQELKGEISSPWQPLEEEFEPPAPPLPPPTEITLGPAVSSAPAPQPPAQSMAATLAAASPSNVTTPAAGSASKGTLGLGEITDQNYLDILGRALDLVGWSDDRADEYSQKTFSIAHWDELGRSQVEKLILVLEAELAAKQPSEEAPV
jgi:DNA-binding transcriptional MerR regulator